MIIGLKANVAEIAATYLFHFLYRVFNKFLSAKSGVHTHNQHHGKYARLLVEKGHAYYCFCEKTESEEDSGQFDRASDPCRALSQEEAQARVDAGEPYVIRQKIPSGGTTTFHDAIFGDITVENDTLDDQVLIKRDGLPTYNFANVIDDHLPELHCLRSPLFTWKTRHLNLAEWDCG